MANKGTLRQYFTQGADTTLIKSYNADIALFSTVFEWEVKSQDIITNKSVINWTYKIETYDLSAWESNKISFGTAESLLIGVTSSSSYSDIYVDIDDNVLVNPTDFSLSVASNSSATLASGEYTINHKTDGTALPLVYHQIRIKDFYDENGIPSNNDGQLNATCFSEGNITIDSIPRHAVIQSAPNFTDEDSPTITFAIPSGATNVRAYISFSTSTIDIGSYAVSGSSYTFRFTDAEKRKLWSILDEGLDTKQVYFYVKSDFNGTTYYSSLIRTLTVVNYTPTIAPEVYDTNEAAIALTGDSFKLIRYVSNAYWKTGAQGRKGATIVTQSVANGGKTYYGASGTIEGVTSPSFDFAAIDSYGRSITSNYNVAFAAGYWIEYIKLTCSSEVTEMTADGDVKVTLKGKYFDGNFGAKSNRMRMHYDITKDGDEMEHVDWGYIDRTDSRGSWTHNSSTFDYTYEFTISGLDYMSVYNVTVRVSDEVSVEGTETHVLIASDPIFDWGRTDFNFNVPVNINGDLTITGDIKAGGKTVPTIQSQGTAGIWTYRTWSDGTAECWGKKDFTVNVTSAWGSMYTSGAISGSNVSFPFGLFAETPVVNASLLVRSAGGILMAPGGAGSNIANMDQTGVYEIARGTSLSNAAYTINYDVKGRWK